MHVYTYLYIYTHMQGARRLSVFSSELMLLHTLSLSLSFPVCPLFLSPPFSSCRPASLPPFLCMYFSHAVDARMQYR